jgi:hypothetical protein
MKLESLVRALDREALLVVRSDEELANGVLEAAKVQAERNPMYAHGKPPRPVAVETAHDDTSAGSARAGCRDEPC